MFAARFPAKLPLQEKNTKEELQMNILLLTVGLVFVLPMLVGFFHFLHVKDKADAMNGRMAFLKGHWPHAHQG